MATVKGAGAQKVKIELFYDGAKYKDPVFVSVNGESYMIQRGVEVEVPVYVVEVLENSRKQDKHAKNYMKQLQREGDW